MEEKFPDIQRQRAGHVGGGTRAQLRIRAHPLHATALTIHAVTGADIPQLSLVRGIDINETATTKVREKRASISMLIECGSIRGGLPPKRLFFPAFERFFVPKVGLEPTHP